MSYTQLQRLKYELENCKLSIYNHFSDKSAGGIYTIDDNQDNFLLTNLTIEEPNYDYPLVTIGKEFWFEAAHNLPYYEGKCHQLHGHSFYLQVYIKDRIKNDTKMVLDYKILKEIVTNSVLDLLDHNNLNNLILPLTGEKLYPTSEMLLLFIWYRLEIIGKLKGLHKVLLKETNNSMSEITYLDMLDCGLYINNVYKKAL